MNKEKNPDERPVGVIGAGSFGTAVANLLAHNSKVMLYSRQPDIVRQINLEHTNLGHPLSSEVSGSNSLKEVAENCTLIFPIVPSSSFRGMIRALSPYLRPYHILIHGTKGFDSVFLDEKNKDVSTITRKDVHSMSEVIRQESVVIRIGCLAGPNLASEILKGLPAGTVIASPFDEVIRLGRQALTSRFFHVYGSHDILGAELAGALKNIIAIGSGILGGLDLGKNIQAMLITQGLYEMIRIGEYLGATKESFLGTSGIGDLIATATSPKSRNYAFGMTIARGKNYEEILDNMPELAEGVRTLKVMRFLARYHKIRVPITEMLYNVVYEEYDIMKALEYLMNYPYDVNADSPQ